MTGDELKNIHLDIEESLGIRLSVNRMADLCGMAPKNGGDTFRKWEDGDGPSGPVAQLMSLYKIGTKDGTLSDRSTTAGIETLKKFGVLRDCADEGVLMDAVEHVVGRVIAELMRERLNIPPVKQGG